MPQVLIRHNIQRKTESAMMRGRDPGRLVLVSGLWGVDRSHPAVLG